MKRETSKKSTSSKIVEFLSKSPEKCLALTEKERQEFERAIVAEEQAKKTKFPLGGPVKD